MLRTFRVTVFSFLVILLCLTNIYADEIRPSDEIGAIRTAIMDAKDGDVIILERGKVYYTQATIDINTSITIKADENTTGRKPIIAFLVKEDGSIDEEMIFVRASLSCSNIHFHGGISGSIEENINRAVVFVDTPNMRAVFDKCWFEDFDARTVQLEAPDIRFFATNCIWCDDHKAGGPSEGRSLDLRQYGPDTLSIKNCSFLNIGDRWVRHLPSSGRLDPINYAVIDHCTFINGVNYRPGFDFGHLENLQYTNNIVNNPGILGTDFMRRPGKNDGALLLADPENYYSSDKSLAPHRLREVFYDRTEGIVVFACHGVDSMGTKITMHHNNCYMDQAIIDKIAENDTLSVQKWWCSQFRNSIQGDSTDAFTLEQLNFVNAPDLLVDIVDDYFGYWDQNQYLYMDRTAPDSVDLSYGSTAAAYTAAQGGFPLGDLNWYPDKKAEWEGWITGVNNDQAVQPVQFDLSQNFPNPFNPVTTIDYNISKTTHVSLDVYNTIGQKVRSLVNATQIGGSYQMTWNGQDDTGAQLPSGIYFYRLQAGNETMMKKMTMVK